MQPLSLLTAKDASISNNREKFQGSLQAVGNVIDDFHGPLKCDSPDFQTQVNIDRCTSCCYTTGCSLRA